MARRKLLPSSMTVLRQYQAELPGGNKVCQPGDRADVTAAAACAAAGAAVHPVRCWRDFAQQRYARTVNA